MRAVVLRGGRLDLAEQFGAHVLVDAADESPFEVWRRIRKERWITKPAVVFECVGAPGLLGRIVDSCEMWTRSFAAGGWYTGDTIDCTKATHRGVEIQFGGGPHPEDWYGTLDPRDRRRAAVRPARHRRGVDPPDPAGGGRRQQLGRAVPLRVQGGTRPGHRRPPGSLPRTAPAASLGAGARRRPAPASRPTSSPSSSSPSSTTATT